MKIALEKVRPVALTLQIRLTDILMQNTKRVVVNQVSVHPFERFKAGASTPNLPKVQKVQNRDRAHGCRIKCESAALHRINASAQKATACSSIALSKFKQNRQVRLIRAENRSAARESYNAIMRRQCRANGAVWNFSKKSSIMVQTGVPNRNGLHIEPHIVQCPFHTSELYQEFKL